MKIFLVLLCAAISLLSGFGALWAILKLRWNLFLLSVLVLMASFVAIKLVGIMVA